MTYKRLLFLYVFFIAVFFALVCRVFLLAGNQIYADTAQTQTVTTLSLPTQRGNFYDFEGAKLTGLSELWYALCIPGEASYTTLFNYVDIGAQNTLYKNRNSAVPFFIEVDEDLTSLGIFCVKGEERYASMPLMPHLIGYQGSDGTGITGLEYAMEETLAGTGAQHYIQCITNAQGELMQDTVPTYYGEDTMVQDVALTISKTIQRTAEGVASGMMPKGAIVILDTETAQVRASVSMPAYDPNNVQKSISANDTSLINRPLNVYNVGSVFKPVLAVAAMEQDLGWFYIDCKGYSEVDGHVYRCANDVAHGFVNINTALEQSCNSYFVELGQLLGGENVLQMAKDLGFGSPVYITGGLQALEGYLPDESTIQNTGQLANLSFGQGQLLATPVQVAGMINTIVNGGVYLTPTFINGLYDPIGKTITQKFYSPEPKQVIDEEIADALENMLIDVVEEGIGGKAKPNEGGAGGKTGTAQTGRYDEDENEYMDLWFAGFYPAENPKYTIVVMQDEQTNAEYSSAEIFAELCNAINLLENS